MKLRSAVLSCWLCLGAVGTAAAAEFAANVTYATDYRFRGISQGDRSQAIQGGFDISAENGLYFGTWASNVTFSGASIEVDYYAGWSGALTEDVGVDVGVLWYNYPEDDAPVDLDYYELYGSISYRDATLGFAYSPDYFAETDAFVYLYGDYAIALGDDWSLDLHVGYNAFDDDAAFASFIGPAAGEDPGDDYLDYSVGVSTERLGVEWALRYVGTDLDDEECFGGTRLCDDSAVFSVSKSF